MDWSWNTVNSQTVRNWRFVFNFNNLTKFLFYCSTLSTPPAPAIATFTVGVVVVVLFLIFLIVIIVLLSPTRALTVFTLALSCPDLLLLQPRQLVPDVVCPALYSVPLVAVAAPRPPALPSARQGEPTVVVALQLVAPPHTRRPRELGLT